jgi:hypothetical protein
MDWMGRANRLTPSIPDTAHWSFSFGANKLTSYPVQKLVVPLNLINKSTVKLSLQHPRYCKTYGVNSSIVWIFCEIQITPKLKHIKPDWGFSRKSKPRSLEYIGVLNIFEGGEQFWPHLIISLIIQLWFSKGTSSGPDCTQSDTCRIISEE